MSEPAPTPQTPNVEELQKQLNVLERKIAETKEPIVREALQARVTEIVTQLGPELARRPIPEAKKEETLKQEAAEEPLPEPPSAQATLEADNFIRLAKVAKMRDQHQEAARLLQQAADVAPGAPNVLEMLGDELVERKRFGEARVVYRKALRISPKNVTLDRKHALMVLRTSSPMSFEAAMRSADSPFVAPDDSVASAKAATTLSFFAPGTGQLVLGETNKGFTLLFAWVLCIFVLTLMSQDIQGIVHSLGGQKASYSDWVYLPIAAMLLVYIIAVGGCASRIKSHWKPARSTERPVPPENLPFE